MRKTSRAEFWVVYQRTIMVLKKQIVSNAVCEQSEWGVMGQANSGVKTLVREQIESEEAAEKLARGRPATTTALDPRQLRPS